MENKVNVEVKSRYVRLSEDHIEFLFGDGYELTNVKDLNQPELFECEETVTIVSESGKKIENVRIIGPSVPQTYVVISKSDAIDSEIDAPVRWLDDLDDSAACYITGPEGELHISEGVIICMRHIHFSLDEAKEYGVKNGDIVSVKVDGDKGGIMHNVLCIVDFNHKLEMHIDSDDANAFLLKQGDIVEIIK